MVDFSFSFSTYTTTGCGGWGNWFGGGCHTPMRWGGGFGSLWNCCSWNRPRHHHGCWDTMWRPSYHHCHTPGLYAPSRWSFNSWLSSLAILNLADRWSSRASASRRSQPTSTNTTTPVSSTPVSNAAKTITDPVVSNTDKDKAFRQSIVSTADKYMGYDETNGGYKEFAAIVNGQPSKEWCCDFASHVVKKAYEEQGLQAPTGFGCHQVEDMRSWAIDNNRYLKTSNLTDDEKKSKVKEKVNPGDLLILLEGGASHIGVVKSVDSNGNITTVEGNRDDKVTNYTYTATDSKISGFVQLNA